MEMSIRSATKKIIYLVGIVVMVLLFIASFVILITQTPTYFTENVGWRFETIGSFIALIFIMVISMIAIAGLYFFYRWSDQAGDDTQLIEYDLRRIKEE